MSHKLFVWELNFVKRQSIGSELFSHSQESLQSSSEVIFLMMIS